MDKLLEFILKGIFPDDTPTFKKREEEGYVEYNIQVIKDNMGKIIGKEGRVIKAIRNIMKIKATLEHIKVNLILTEVQA